MSPTLSDPEEPWAARAASASLLLALAAIAGCGSNHRVSPWGDREGAPVGAFAVRPDLEAQLRAIDEELAGANGAADEARRLALLVELRGQDSAGTAYVVRDYAGRDALGRPVHAVRVATQFAVVFAAGPRGELEPGGFDQLVAALPGGPGETVRMPADFDGDGRPELILVDPRGRPQAVTLAPRGAVTLAISPPLPVARAPHLGPGRRGLTLVQRVAGVGARELVLERLVVLRGGAFVEDDPAVVAWHASEAEARARADGEESEEAALDRLLARAFHAALAGASWADEKRALVERATAADRTPAWRQAIARLERALER